MKLGIIIGSVRQGRVSANMAEWIASAARERTNLKVEVIDLKEYDLPMFDEAVSPQYNQDRKPDGELKRWLDALSAADAYVVVTPEYNRSIPGALKNAFDLVAHEMAKKPVAIATHGSTEGAQAVAAMRTIVPGMNAVTTPAFLGISFMGAQGITEDGMFEGDEAQMRASQLKAMLDEITWYGEALKQKSL